MDKIITLEGDALRDLLRELDPHGVAEVHTLRVAIDGDEVKYKVNEGMWTPGYPLAAEQRSRPPTKAPDLTQHQLDLLGATLRLEGPYVRDEVDDGTYTYANAKAQDAGLGDVLEVLAQHFVATHASADEISASAETDSALRATLEDAYTDNVLRAVVQDAYADDVSTQTPVPSFKCEAKIWGGPGHQSSHRCTNTTPHPLDGNHYVSEVVQEWTGATAFTAEL